MRKLADSNCWMTDNLALSLTTGTSVVVSKNDGSTFSFTPTACNTNGACAMNGNTLLNTTNNQWYYSWYAATAGEGKEDSTGDIDGSICPVHWKLPSNYTIDQDKSYGSLTNAYGLTIDGENNTTDHTAELEGFPLGFERLGNYYASTWNNGGIYSIYWSSTALSNTVYAYGLNYRTLYTHPQGNTYKNRGLNVRCVAI